MNVTFSPRQSRRYSPYTLPHSQSSPDNSRTSCHSPCTQVYYNLDYLTPPSSTTSYGQCPQDSGIPSWNLLCSSEAPPPLHYDYPNYLPSKPESDLSQDYPYSPPSPSTSSVYSYCSSDPQYTINPPTTSQSPHMISRSPGPIRTREESPPLAAPVPRRGAKPVVLSCELPDLDEDLSHGPYIRPSKRRRKVDNTVGNSTQAQGTRTLRRSSRLFRDEQPGPSH